MKFSTEIYCIILENYDFDDNFNNFKEIRKLSSVCKLFNDIIEKLLIKVYLIDEDNMKYNPEPTHTYFFIENNTKNKISYKRFKNIRSIYYSWQSLQTQKISYGSSFYKARSRFTIEYIIPKNIFYERYYKFPYFIENINNKTVFEIKSIFGFNKKFVIDYDIGLLDFWKLGELDKDWVHCHDLSYHFTELILKKLLLFKYLKNKYNKIRNIYNNLFHNFDSNNEVNLIDY
ncbi:14296_t:CDS:1 [Cetraspora pellucida]|uniref:14296_t:CDS:1 n=1 Tax=Cetraspora pellucida TaxID=1433469 RepID=A0A9N9IRP1_9GLOM|nr:14296_t:CDS:1 [Cetraspora pellucida]